MFQETVTHRVGCRAGMPVGQCRVVSEPGFKLVRVTPGDS
jgi:hypothetical protein